MRGWKRHLSCSLRTHKPGTAASQGNSDFCHYAHCKSFWIRAIRKVPRLSFLSQLLEQSNNNAQISCQTKNCRGKPEQMSDGRNFTNSAKPSGNFTLTEDEGCQEWEAEREIEGGNDVIEARQLEPSRVVVHKRCCYRWRGSALTSSLCGDA